jgi:hypothetical protein
LICQMRIGLSTAAQATQSIEHAGTHEAYEGDHIKLEPWRRVPGRAPMPYPERLVHPSSGKLEIPNRLFDIISKHGPLNWGRISASRSINHNGPDGDLGRGEVTYKSETNIVFDRNWLGEDYLFISNDGVHQLS